MSYDPELCSTLNFQKKVWEYYVYHIVYMVFQKKYFSCDALLIDQISLPDIVQYDYCNCFSTGL